MLSNITDGADAGLQTILLGQPQFRRRMASPDFDQLRQRVLASYHLAPLDRGEARAYVEHRLRRVDWDGTPSWSDDAFAAIHHHSGGTPRRINRLCARVLLHGALDARTAIDRDLVEITANELDDDLRGPDQPEPSCETPSAPNAELLGRIEALERLVARREALFSRLRELINAYVIGPRVRG